MIRMMVIRKVASYLLGSDRKGLELTGTINLAAAGSYGLRVRIKDTESQQVVEQTIAFGITR